MVNLQVPAVRQPSSGFKESLQRLLPTTQEIAHVGAYFIQLRHPISQQLEYVSQIVDSRISASTELLEQLNCEAEQAKLASFEAPSDISRLGLNQYCWLYAFPIATQTSSDRLLVLAKQHLSAEQTSQLHAIVQAIATYLDIWHQRHAYEAKTVELESVLHSVEHQVRQSLGLANLYLSLLEGQSLDEPSRNVTGNLRTTVTEIADRLTAILSQQQHPITVLPIVDVRQLVSDRGQAFAPSLQAKELTLNIPASTVWLQADPHQIGQVIDNLLCNAIAFSPTGGAITWTWDMFDGEVLMQIADQGPGIPAAAGKDIFRSGYTRRPDGQGLGLAIVQRIVREHGGRIWVNNLASGGAQFSVIFPQTPLPQS